MTKVCLVAYEKVEGETGRTTITLNRGSSFKTFKKID